MFKTLKELLFVQCLLWSCYANYISAQEEILSFDSHVMVTSTGDLMVEETIKVRAEGDLIKRGITRSLPNEYKRKQSLSSLLSTRRVPRAEAASFKVTKVQINQQNSYGWVLDQRVFGTYLRFNGSFLATLPHSEAELSVEYQYVDKRGSLQQRDFTASASAIALENGIYIDYIKGYQRQNLLAYIYGRLVHAHLFSLTDRQALSIKNIEKDGVAEPWFTKQQNGQLGLFIGQRFKFLEVGEYEYKIQYEYKRQSWHEAGRDRVSWNVIGNDSVLKISGAKVRIDYPSDINRSDVSLNVYTGYNGELGNHFEVSSLTESSAVVSATKTLLPGESMTVDIAWPEGTISHRPSLESLGSLLSYNKEVFTFFICWFALIGLYLRTWIKHGRDPKSKLVTPRYQAPGQESPATMRYNNQNGEYDNRVFSSALISLASKGFLKIAKQGDGFVLTKLKDQNHGKMSGDEREVYQKLFSKRALLDPTKKSHAKLLYRAYEQHHARLAIYNKPEKYFIKNRGSRFWLGFSVFVMWAWSLFFSLRHFTYEFWAFNVFTILVVITCTSANRLIGRPTQLGANRAPEMEGFFQYLTMGETDELRSVHPLNKTPEVYQEYLPYAVALDIEDIWGEKFSEVLSDAVLKGMYETFGIGGVEFSRQLDSMNQHFRRHIDNTRDELNRERAKKYASSSSSSGWSSSSGGSSWGGSRSGGSSSGGSSGGGSGGGGVGGW